MNHLSPEQLSALLDGALDSRTQAEADRHVGACERCRAALEQLAGQDEQLARSLAHDPGEAYFESFADRVAGRIRAAEPAPGPARDAGSAGWLGWLLAPRTLAWAGSAAAIVAVAGLVFILGRERADIALQRPEVLDRTRQQAAPAAPGGAESAEPDAARESGEVAEPAPEAMSAPDAGAGTEEARREGFAGQADALSDARMNEVRRTPEGEEVPVPDRRTRVVPEPSLKAEPAPATTGPVYAGRSKARARADESAPPPAPGTEAGALEAGTQGFAAPPAAEKSAASSELRAQADRERRAIGVVGDAEVAGRVCGTVTDPAGRVVPGAQVGIADLGVTTATDRDGQFCIDAPRGGHTLTVLRVGFEATRTGVTVAPRETLVTFRITLRPVNVLGAPHTHPPGALSPGVPAAGLVERARTLEAGAVRRPSAERYEAAAAAWDSVAAASGGPALVAARERSAETRFRAWELAPTTARAAGATNAITAYLAVAPRGPARDLALIRAARLAEAR